MQKKTLTVLIVLCAVTGVLGWYVKYWTTRQWQAADDLVGKPIFASLVADEVAEISLRTINGELRLRRGPAGDWQLPGMQDYPADPAKVSGFLGRLRALIANRQVAAGPEALGALGLNPPTARADTGMDVALLGRDGRQVLAFRLGKEHLQEPMETKGADVPVTQPRLGSYLLLPATGKVYVVDQRAFAGVSDSPMDWVDATVLPVAVSLQEIEARQAGATRWRLQREVAEAPLVLTEADTQVVGDERRIADVAAILPGMTFVRVAAADTVDEMAFLRATTIRATAFDGIAYALEFGQRNDLGETPVRLTVSYAKPAPPEVAEEASPEVRFAAWQAHEERVRSGEDLQRRLRHRYDDWVYYIATVTADRLLVPATELGVTPAAGDDDDDGEEAEEEGEAVPPATPDPVPPAPQAGAEEAPAE